MIGRKLLHYEITEKLGEGGMGVVYKARDTHLDRFVAIKVLPPEKVADPSRKARFVREAKAASALNHPNIITIHDISTDDGADFIAMEYVQGKTLDQLIPRNGVRLNEALKVAVQISDALAKAHAASIIHRDLKPSNVMVTPDGVVKVLDFGLAKLTEKGVSEDEATATIPVKTDEGAIVGTAAYMSPEQAEGKTVDARSDIFSFGALLYEMITGHRAFPGDSKISTLSAVLHQEPAPIEDAPNDLKRIIAHCLRKDPARRFQHMDDVRSLLEVLKEESDSGKLVSTAPAVTVARHAWHRPWAAVVPVIVALVLGWYYLRPAPSPAMTVVPLTSYAGAESFPAFSPDGQQVAFTWNGEKQDNDDIYVQWLGSGTPLRLTSDPRRDSSAAWSPDGRHIAFLRELARGKWGVFLVPPLGGPERKLAEVSAGYGLQSGLAWSPDSQWLVTSERDSPRKPLALFLLSVETGEKRRLTTPPMSVDGGDEGAAFSPDGRTLAFCRGREGSVGDIYLQALTEDLRPKGDPARLTSENRWFAGLAWTPDGREIIFSSGNTVPTLALWRIPVVAQAKPRRLDFAGEGVRTPAIARLRWRLAYARWHWDTDIWRVETAGARAGQVRKFISSTRQDLNPQFSPDGTKIAFPSHRSGSAEIWRCDADGSNAVQLTHMGGSRTAGGRWSPDGQYIVFSSVARGNRDIYVISAGGGKARALTSETSEDGVPSWSRDGRWIYFSSTRGADRQIWRIPWTPRASGVGQGGEAVQVTRNGGYVAFESWDGKSLYYTKSPSTSPLFRLPLDGGVESQVLESVHRSAFAVTERGIYFISAPDARGIALLQFFDLTTGKSKLIAALDQPLSIGLTVSPDGGTVLYSQSDVAGADLILAENFR